MPIEALNLNAFRNHREEHPIPVQSMLSDQIYFRAGFACSGQTIQDRAYGIADFYRTIEKKLFLMWGLAFVGAENQTSLGSDRSEIFRLVFEKTQRKVCDNKW